MLKEKECRDDVLETGITEGKASSAERIIDITVVLS
jgi:hypothetical protein